MFRKSMYVIAAILVIVPIISLAQGEPVVPPTDLPPLVTGLLGVLAPIIAQLVVNRVSGRLQRFIISLVLTGITGAAAYFIVKPPVSDQVDFFVYFFAYAQIAYQGLWRSLWDSTIPLPSFLKRVEGGK